MKKYFWIFMAICGIILAGCGNTPSESLSDTASAAGTDLAENAGDETAASLSPRDENGWNADMMTLADVPPAMGDIAAFVTYQDKDSLTVRLTNYGTEEFGFGVAFHVEVFLGKRWYEVPAKDIEYDFPAQSLILPAKGSCEINYDLYMYDEFPAGRYRIVNGGDFWFEFTAGAEIASQNRLAEEAVRYVAVSYFDGRSVTIAPADKDRQINEILNIISAEPAERAYDWSGSMAEAPIFGISAADAAGWAFEGAWSNGYWVDQYGKAYRLELDTEQLKQKMFQLESKTTVTENAYIAQLLCGTYLCRDENGWIADSLVPSDRELPEPPENITAEIAGDTADHITLQYTNNGEKKWTYGEAYRIEVQLDGKWYDVPQKPGNWAFHSIGYILEAGQTRGITHNFEAYDEFPAGRYRIITEDFAFEFDV